MNMLKIADLQAHAALRCEHVYLLFSQDRVLQTPQLLLCYQTGQTVKY